MEEVRPGAITLYTVEEAASQLRMSRASLYRLVKEKKVPHRKLKGIGIAFTPGDIAQIIDDAHRPAVA